MNYKSHYDRLIDRARTRTLSGFMVGEKNHRFGKKASSETRAKQSISMKAYIAKKKAST